MENDRSSHIPVFDGHNDTLLRIAMLEPDDDWSFDRSNGEGAIDLVRAEQGEMVGGIFAMMTPPGRGEDAFRRDEIVRTEEGYEKPMAPRVSQNVAHNFAEQLMDLAEALERANDGRFFVATSYRALREGVEDGRVAAVLHFEGAEPIDEDLDNLQHFYDRGLRSLGLVWSRPNAFGHGVPFRFPSSPDTGPGLTGAGKRLVDACNDLGIVIDCAHLNAAGFHDVASRSADPLVVSHACCHAICPSARNLTDEQIDAVGESDGVIGINFFVADLREDGYFDRATPLDQIVEHIDHIVDRIGVDHVAFGSDFDGARMPRELGDASAFPRLLAALADSGYDEAQIRKIASENWFRVFEKTWEKP